MKIAVYSGSFNPLHYGHIDILQGLYETVGIDKVIVVVSPKNPSKPESLYLQTPIERLEAVKSVIESNGWGDKIEASDIEFSRIPPIYTIDTLQDIQRLYPDAELWYVCGSDNLRKIMRWRNAKAMLERIIVFERPGYDMSAIASEALKKFPESKICQMSMKPREISSTEIRDLYNSGQDYSHLTPIKI